ncbi:E3 ubiquitin-protein ligase MARCHF2 isoform X1 [Hydra vulgaris]|uniref:E3 ubiquitin-protein ligase MARCHF2 isoform X1 n=1 Tax=Hydra vulgaris TaxID=6087 RepID=UPI001F5F163E|nr:E3 ubiquitin-protein ligase MARCHF2-like [Hydra vulgaris]
MSIENICIENKHANFTETIESLSSCKQFSNKLDISFEKNSEYKETDNNFVIHLDDGEHQGIEKLTSVVDICRICLENSDNLIAPCECSGTMKYVHESCIVKWLTQPTEKNLGVKSTCEICLSEVVVKPLGYKPIYKWTFPKNSFDFMVYAFTLYTLIVLAFLVLVFWMVSQKCHTSTCLSLYTICIIAFVYFLYHCKREDYPLKLIRSILSANQVWKVYHV